MKKANITDIITWNAGGESGILAVVEYGDNKIQGEEETKKYEEYLKFVLGQITANIGKTKDFEFSSKTELPERPEKIFRYGCEKVTVSVSGDNPACHQWLKRKIEESFIPCLIAFDMADLAGEFIKAGKHMLDGFIITIRQMKKEE